MELEDDVQQVRAKRFHAGSAGQRDLLNSLCESQGWYREIFENVTDIVSVTDVEGNFVMVNGAAERLVGYPREEALRMNIAQVLTSSSFLIRGGNNCGYSMRRGEECAQNNN